MPFAHFLDIILWCHSHSKHQGQEDRQFFSLKLYPYYCEWSSHFHFYHLALLGTTFHSFYNVWNFLGYCELEVYLVLCLLSIFAKLLQVGGEPCTYNDISLANRMKQKLKIRSKSTERICQRDWVQASTPTWPEPPTVPTPVELRRKPAVDQSFTKGPFLGKAKALVGCPASPYDLDALAFNVSGL